MKLIISVIVAMLLLPQAAAALCVQGDCMNGQGTVVLPDGRKYVGEFIDGIRSGRGLMTFPDGTKYLGDWQNDTPNGQGTLTSVGKFEYAGGFKNGIRHGQGTLETVDGKKYVGKWQDDVPHGNGEVVYPDGGKFVGHFVNGRRSGEGEAAYPDGIKYIGHWSDDLPNGQGTRIFPDGKKYSGEFRDGLMHGQGVAVMPDGSRFNGQWQGDVLIKKEEIAPEAKFSTVDETAGHVLGVVDEKPAEARVVAKENEMAAEPATSAAKVNVLNSSADYASVNKNGVFVRSGPTTEYRVVFTAYKGFPVQITGSQDDWTQITDFMGREGWIYTPLLENNNSVIVKAVKANLRSGAGLQFMVVTQIDSGTVLQVNNIKDDWYMVTTSGGLEGWLSNELVWPAGNEVTLSRDSSETDVMVTSENLQPDQGTEVKEQVMVEEVNVAVEEVKVVPEIAEAEKNVRAEPAASPVEISSEAADNRKEGDYVSILQNGRGANIRSEPLLDAEVLYSVFPGFPLLIVERQGDWTLVEDFRNRRGWVHSTLLADFGAVVIKVEKGNLRSGPSLTAEIVAKLDYGAIMSLDATEGEWVQVSNSEGLAGWLHNEVIWPQ